VPADLPGLAAAALGQDVVAAEVTARTPVSYDPFLAGRDVERVTGTATVPGGGSRTWSAVVKRTAGSGPERHRQPHQLSEAVEELETLRKRPAARELMAILADARFARTRAMITATATRIERLGELPQTLLHHDLVRSNLFALPGSGTAAIDWENVGRGPAGVDLAPLVVGSVRRGEAAADELAALEDLVLAQYEQALTAAGGDSADVRTAYRLALGLRWHVVLGTISAWLDPTVDRIRGSRPAGPRTKGLRHLVQLSRHLLAAAEQS
jgi:hypothetical protein